MLQGMWGKKIGMTQVFSEKDKVVPVTVIDVQNWIVTNIKTQDRDGYDAVQVGLIRPKYASADFASEWLKKTAKYFSFLREVSRSELSEDVVIGKPIDILAILNAGQKVDVFGITKGCGFQGAVKRHGYSGGRASHGPRFGRRPGSLSFMRSEGKVIKGKGMPGHMGAAQRVMHKLEVVKIDDESRIVLVKGSVPGKAGSLVFMRKV